MSNDEASGRQRVSGWGRFGFADRRGTLNFIDSEVMLRALSLPRLGRVISLNRPITGAAGAGRPALRRLRRLENSPRQLADGRRVVVNDDVVELALQGWSHWDSLAHMGVVEPGSDGAEGVFYGDRGLDETAPQPFARSLGVDAFGAAIVTRGVLLDLVSALAGGGAPCLPAGTRVNRAAVERCLERQATTLQRGDVVALYTGYAQRPAAEGASGGEDAGIDGSTLELWERSQIAALGCDNLAVEAIPVDYEVHTRALRDLGLPLGELWALDELAAECRADGRYDFLFVSVPLSIPGAFGSPVNAVAIR